MLTGAQLARSKFVAAACGQLTREVQVGSETHLAGLSYSDVWFGRAKEPCGLREL